MYTGCIYKSKRKAILSFSFNFCVSWEGSVGEMTMGRVVIALIISCLPHSAIVWGAKQFILNFQQSSNQVIVSDLYYSLEYSIWRGTQEANEICQCRVSLVINKNLILFTCRSVCSTEKSPPSLSSLPHRWQKNSISVIGNWPRRIHFLTSNAPWFHTLRSWWWNWICTRSWRDSLLAVLSREKEYKVSRAAEWSEVSLDI